MEAFDGKPVGFETEKWFVFVRNGVCRLSQNTRCDFFEDVLAEDGYETRDEAEAAIRRYEARTAALD